MEILVAQALLTKLGLKTQMQMKRLNEKNVNNVRFKSRSGRRKKHKGIYQSR